MNVDCWRKNIQSGCEDKFEKKNQVVCAQPCPVPFHIVVGNIEDVNCTFITPYTNFSLIRSKRNPIKSCFIHPPPQLANELTRESIPYPNEGSLLRSRRYETARGGDT